jgi:hypothetical protein
MNFKNSSIQFGLVFFPNRTTKEMNHANGHQYKTQEGFQGKAITTLSNSFIEPNDIIEQSRAGL